MRHTGVDVYTDIVLPKIDEIKVWFSLGYSLNKIADKLGISHTKFWQLTKDEDKIALKNALSYSDLANQNVETALYNKAVGYYVPVKRAMKLKKVYWDELGRKCEKEEIAMIEEQVYYPPDFYAQRYWLVNRNNERWKYEHLNVDTSAEQLAKGDELVLKIKKLASDDDKESGSK